MRAYRGLAAAFAVYKLGSFGGRVSAFSTLLSGIAVNAFCGALVGFFMYSARDVGLRGYVFWSLGSLGQVRLGRDCRRRLRNGCRVRCNGNLRKRAKFDGARTPAGFPLGRKYPRNLARRRGSRGSRNVRERSNLRNYWVCRACRPTHNKVRRRPRQPDTAAAIGDWGSYASRARRHCRRLWSPADPVPIGVVTAFLGAPFFLALLKRRGESDND